MNDEGREEREANGGGKVGKARNESANGFIRKVTMANNVRHAADAKGRKDRQLMRHSARRLRRLRRRHFLIPVIMHN